MNNGFILERIASFRYAFAGLIHVIRTQKNAWIHLIATGLVFILALWLALPAEKIAILILPIALVWSAECTNTAIETLIDLVSPDHHELARISKDAAAAAVLVFALASILIGFLILGPPLWYKIQFIIK